jgi:hypothetical protein
VRAGVLHARRIIAGLGCRAVKGYAARLRRDADALPRKANPLRWDVDVWLKVSIGAAVGGILTLAAAVATGWFRLREGVHGPPGERR